MPEKLRRKHAIPRQPGILGHIHEQRHVTVRQRGKQVAFLQAFEPPSCIRPGAQAVPGVIKVILVLGSQGVDPQLCQHVVEDHPVQLIDAHPRQLPLAHPVHCRPVAIAPGVRDRRPVHLQILLFSECAAFANDAAAPVHHGTENVESQRANYQGGHGPFFFIVVVPQPVRTRAWQGL